MKTFFQFAIISTLMIFAAPAFAGSAVAIYECQQADSASEEDVTETAAKWLAKAKGMKAGENLEVRVLFPVAASMDDNDFMFVVIAPSFAEWGAFMDAFHGAEDSDDDKDYADIAQCNNSSLWESFKD